MKLGKTLCSIILFAFLHKTQEVMKSARGTSQSYGFGNSAKVCEHKIKDCARSWTFQHKTCDLRLFL